MELIAKRSEPNLSNRGKEGSSHFELSQQSTKIASTKRDEPPFTSNASTRKLVSPRSSTTTTPHAGSLDASKIETDDELLETSTSNQSHSHSSHHSSSVSIGVGTGGILSLIQNVLSNSAVPILRAVTFGAQFAIACYLAKASWTVVKDVWDEVNEEFTAARGGTKGGGGDADVREEQDLPYADENALSGGLGGEDGDEGDVSDSEEEDDLRPQTKRRRQSQSDGVPTPRRTATRELAARLHSAGIPYASEISAENSDKESAHSSTRSVEDIVSSLTRAEGNVLTQTLLTPLDGGLLGGGSNMESPAAAAAAWNAIGGLSEAKESLLDLAFPLLPTQADSGNGKNSYYGGLLANPPGVVLYGPPGCGKTILVRALAATVGARFLAVSPSCLLRKYVGETNLNVRALFSVARKISPCVIFVDELDGLFRERGGEDHDVSRDLKTEFLQLWDGIRNHSHGGSGGGSSSSVLVIGATNRPFDVDPAFLRRMPRRVFVGLPDYDSRISVLESMLNHVPLDQNFDLSLVASRTGGYSPSDIREVLQAAALYPLREARAEAISLSQMDNGDGEKGASIPIRGHMPPLRKLRTDDVLRALQVAKPTHFSRKYQRDLMNYVRKSGGSQVPSTTERDTDGNYFIADAGTFSSNYFDQDDEDESDMYSYDEDSSESDSDDI